MDTIVAVQRAVRAEDAEAAGALAEAACVAAGVTFATASDAVSCERAIGVMGAVWGWDHPQLETPLAVALAHGGNLMATVESADGRAIGAAMGMCGPPGSPFHSHIVGVLPEATGRGVGRAIKLSQRAWCLERGIASMTWTFDPLLARNAAFNLSRLGAAAIEYLPDFYGTMTDAINVGQGSDRLLVEWNLTALPPATSRPEPDVADAHVVVADHDGHASEVALPPASARQALVAVPHDVEAVRRRDPAASARWREITREALTTLLASGWRIVDVARADGVQYVLRREDRS